MGTSRSISWTTGGRHLGMEVMSAARDGHGWHVTAALSPICGPQAGRIRCQRRATARERRWSATRWAISTATRSIMHRQGRPGKIEIIAHQAAGHPARPGAGLFAGRRGAGACAIAEDPSPAYDYTTKGNLVAVISNGTAVLGLGDLGALASKPVMEGKAVLFKRFADVDSHRSGSRHQGRRRVHQLRALSRPDLRRHQPRRHQGAGVLHHRAAPARADGHPGLP